MKNIKTLDDLLIIKYQRTYIKKERLKEKFSFLIWLRRKWKKKMYIY